MARKEGVEMTPAQAAVTISALESYLDAGSWDEQLVIFGSAAGITAAHNARVALRPLAVKHYEATRGLR